MEITMKNMRGEEIDYRPIYRNGQFDAVPYTDEHYCLVRKDSGGAIAAGRIFPNETAFVVSDIVGSIYQKAVYDCCEKIEQRLGQVGRETAKLLKTELCKNFGLPQELSEAETEKVLEEMK